MNTKNMQVDNQVSLSVASVNDVISKVAETTTTSYEQKKGEVSTNSGALQNEMKQELQEFTVSTNGLSNRHKDFIGLCDRLVKLGRKQSLFRLKRLFYIDPAEYEYESDKDLDLDSMEDYVTFLENTDIKIEPLMGMDNDGSISTDWVFDDKPFVGIDFLGNRKTTCSYKLNSKWHSLNLELHDLNSKLTDLKVI